MRIMHVLESSANCHRVLGLLSLIAPGSAQPMKGFQSSFCLPRYSNDPLLCRTVLKLPNETGRGTDGLESCSARLLRELVKKR